MSAGDRATPRDRNNTAVEDYLKVIYSHTEWQPEPITPSALASRLGLAASSVTEMVQKLAASGLVSHVRYGAISLTDRGRAMALRMVRRHRLIETWLVDSFGYSWDEVHEEAEVLEHSLSDRLLEAIAGQLGQPTRDPHGDPIPASDGTVMLPDAVVLSDAPAGLAGGVARISDRDPALLRFLEGHGVLLDAPLTVVGHDRSGGGVLVAVGDTQLDLDASAAAAIWVTRTAG